MFTPVIPSTGLVGWRFLQRTYDTQMATFTQSLELRRNTEFFAETIGGITSAEDLVSDRRLMEVALGAFGLQDDIDNRYFIRKILEEGTVNDDALANKFSDTRYADLSAAFGFGPGEDLQTKVPGFAEKLVSDYQSGRFELATGQIDDTMRTALYARRELSEVAGTADSNDAKWYTIMGQPPLRAMMEKALGLPASFSQIDIDQQLAVFKDKAATVFGSEDLSIFSDPERVDQAITKYMARAQLDDIFSSGSSSASIALMLLRA